MTAAAATRVSGTPGQYWAAPFASRPVNATVTVPGSKSLTNRYLVLAALADGPSRLRAPLHSAAGDEAAGDPGALVHVVLEVDAAEGGVGPQQPRGHPGRLPHASRLPGQRRGDDYGGGGEEKGK